jgi:hypothetical protein
MALALAGFMELRMRQSPMNGTNCAEIATMRCEHGRMRLLPRTAPGARTTCGFVERNSAACFASLLRAASDDVVRTWRLRKSFPGQSNDRRAVCHRPTRNALTRPAANVSRAPIPRPIRGAASTDASVKNEGHTLRYCALRAAITRVRRT